MKNMSEYLIPKVSTFGKLLFQGKGEEVKTNRHVTAVKYNVISERQKDLLEVQIPVIAGSKTFAPDTEVELIEPKLEPAGQATSDNRAISYWRLSAKDIVKKGE